MGEMIKVRTNKGELSAEVIRRNPKTVIVKLPDGKIVARRQKHIVS